MPSLNSLPRLRSITQLLLALAVLAVLALPAKAGQSLNFGEYQLHYMALSTASLRPEFAEQYGLPRSDRRAYLNLSVTRMVDGVPMPVPAEISGIRRNLIGQQFPLRLTEVREGLGIYYLDDFPYTAREPIRFRVEVQPEGSERSWTLNFEQRVYAVNR